MSIAVSTHPLTEMTTENPITPPDQLVEEWSKQWHSAHGDFSVYLATRASRWGWEQRNATVEAELQQARDQEMERMIQELTSMHLPEAYAKRLRAALRPDKRQVAMDTCATALASGRLTPAEAARIRAALEDLTPPT